MWSLFSEPIQKDYYAGWLSRSWCLSVACCVFAFVIPILVLISIGCIISYIQIPGIAINTHWCSQSSVFKTTKLLACFLVAWSHTIVVLRMSQLQIVIKLSSLREEMVAT